jgi:hypothetical protein
MHSIFIVITSHRHEVLRRPRSLWRKLTPNSRIPDIPLVRIRSTIPSTIDHTLTTGDKIWLGCCYLLAFTTAPIETLVSPLSARSLVVIDIRVDVVCEIDAFDIFWCLVSLNWKVFIAFAAFIFVDCYLPCWDWCFARGSFCHFFLGR